jgi:hypothetical protein
VRLTIDAVREVRTRDFYGNGDVVMPAGIAELGVLGLAQPAIAPGRPTTAFTTPCRSDLLTVDGRPVPVSIAGTRGDAVSRGGLQVIGCDGLTLGEGRHTLRAAPGAATGIDLDRLDLRSLVTGSDALVSRPVPGLAARTAGVRADGPQVGPVPEVTVVSRGRDRTTVAVRGARPGDPFWLVLAQSQNAGWRARVDGRDLGASSLVDGFANGWRVRPERSSFRVTLQWVPQRTVDLALALSALAALLCLALALADPGRGRRAVEVDDGIATLGFPGAGEDAIGAARTAVAVIGVAALGSLLAGPTVGLGAGLVTLVAARWPRSRVLLAIGPAVALGLAGTYVVWRQTRVHVPPTFEWPLGFTRAHLLGWTAVILLAAAAILELLGRRRDR